MTRLSLWLEGERPREKLLSRGAGSLSDAELLAIFLRTGTQGKNVLELSRDIICHFGNLRNLFSTSEKEFCQIKGLGRAKYVQLQASLEMSQRYLHEKISRQDAMENPAQVKEYVQSRLTGKANEVFSALFLDNQHRVIAFEELFFGTINASSVHPRIILQRSLAHNAAAVIVAHNHPSGVAEPSVSDVSITKTLKTSLGLIDVRLLDHLVVAGDQVTSLAERGQI